MRLWKEPTRLQGHGSCTDVRCLLGGQRFCAPRPLCSMGSIAQWLPCDRANVPTGNRTGGSHGSAEAESSSRGGVHARLEAFWGHGGKFSQDALLVSSGLQLSGCPCISPIPCLSVQGPRGSQPWVVTGTEPCRTWQLCVHLLSCPGRLNTPAAWEGSERGLHLVPGQEL